MAYTLSNKCTKKFCKWTVLIQLIVKDVVTFFGTQCIIAINIINIALLTSVIQHMMQQKNLVSLFT